MNLSTKFPFGIVAALVLAAVSIAADAAPRSEPAAPTTTAPKTTAPKTTAPTIGPSLRPGIAPPPETKRHRGVPAVSGKPVALPPGRCPDPGIMPLTPRWARVNPDGRTFSFYLYTQIHNVGIVPYVSRGNQQIISFYEGGRFLVSLPWYFTSDDAVGAGSTVVASDAQEVVLGPPRHKMLAVPRWDPSSSADFTAEFSYDPDISSDGNPNNDDCNRTNNKVRLTAAELRRLLAKEVKR